MSKYRKRLPQLGNAVCLTDGEIESMLEEAVGSTGSIASDVVDAREVKHANRI